MNRKRNSMSFGYRGAYVPLIKPSMAPLYIKLGLGLTVGLFVADFLLLIMGMVKYH